MNTPAPRCFTLIPAAGVGARLTGAMPKQYMPLAGKPMLQYALDTFAASAAIAHTFVVVSAADAYIDGFLAAQRQLTGKVSVMRCGGGTRQESVRNGLQAIREHASDDDWILVHDAARPGLDAALLDRLIAALRDDAVGGLLALPVVDTLKRCTGKKTMRVQETVPRDALWAAQTPQMFRYALLHRALKEAQAQGCASDITDEASAIEMLGLQPKLVQGNPRNFKVTLPHDIALAASFLQGQK
ncbi:MAG: 2-C-methyl-D-erythritol 4-phosphate cytidylyltransferase [Herbaspirillum sp.]